MESLGGVRFTRYYYDPDATEQTYFVTLRCAAGRYFQRLELPRLSHSVPRAPLRGP
jgi:hypothetical protein